MKENTSLKEAASRDSEALEDALNTNQVLIEEIKVKDAIIEADNTIARQGEKSGTKATEMPSLSGVRCNICDWTSNTATHLAGHMTKHRAGQYICGQCGEKFKTKGELNEHMDQYHKQSQNQQERLSCAKCGKVFSGEHSLKQHISSKHTEIKHLPVGHPDQAKLKNTSNSSISNTAHILCGQCGKAFKTGEEVEVHMQVHIHIEEEEKGTFLEKNELKICRYFKRGFCSKGNQCRFIHSKQYQQPTPQCDKGSMCTFLKQNRCSFFHPGIGVQNPRKTFSPIQTNETRACRYKSQCWKIDVCPFEHPRKGFQFAQKTNRPPMKTNHMNLWMDY